MIRMKSIYIIISSILIFHLAEFFYTYTAAIKVHILTQRVGKLLHAKYVAHYSVVLSMIALRQLLTRVRSSSVVPTLFCPSDGACLV